MWQSGGNLVAAFHIVHQYSLSEIAEGNIGYGILRFVKKIL